MLKALDPLTKAAMASKDKAAGPINKGELAWSKPAKATKTVISVILGLVNAKMSPIKGGSLAMVLS